MLEDLKLPEHTRPCKARTVKESLEKSDQDILEKLLMSSEWPVKTLERALAEKGIRLGEGVIRKHRTKACGCFER